jgi:hypothetical protein
MADDDESVWLAELDPIECERNARQTVQPPPSSSNVAPMTRKRKVRDTTTDDDDSAAEQWQEAQFGSAPAERVWCCR